MSFLVLFCMILGGASPAAAQQTDGRLMVTVKDAAGDVVSGAKVTVTSVATNQVVEGTTNEQGVAIFAQLQVAAYNVRVEAAGFGTAVYESVKIDVGQDYGLVAEVAAGAVTETVTVTAGEELVSSTNSEVSTTVNERQVQDLPLNGRNPLQLIQLQPGVTGDDLRTTHINGQRTSSTSITQDGINIQDNFIRDNATDFVPARTSVSQVAEFTVTTSNASVDSQGAASIRLVTPSGTNDLHGSLFEYHRNSALGANDFFNNAAIPGVEKPQLIRNQFGFTIGGPVTIPGVFNGKDRLFFFGSYEGFRERTDAVSNSLLYTPAARQGLFTYVDDSGRVRTVDLLELSGTQADPFVAANIFGRMPNVINNSNLGDGFNTGGYSFNQAFPTDRNQGGGRLDFVLNSAHSFEAVYQYVGENQLRPDIDTTFSSDPFVGLRSSNRFGVAAWNWSVNSRLYNELRAGFNNSRPEFFSTDENPGFFITLAGVNDPGANFDAQGRRSDIRTIADTASYAIGNHFFRFGGQHDKLRIRLYQNAGVTPNFLLGFSAASEIGLGSGDFEGGISGDQLATANALLADVTGTIGQALLINYNAISQTSGLVQGVGENRDIQYTTSALFVGDQWRISPRVTLNLGLRWDYTSPLREENNLFLAPVANGRTSGRDIVLDPNGTVDFVNGDFYAADKNNFAPNIGVAFDVFGDGKTVVRGAYSQAYINDAQVTAARNALAGNNGLQFTYDNLNTQLFAGIDDIPNLLATELVPPTFTFPYTFAEGRAFDSASAAFIIDPELETPKYHQWNVSVEREIGWDTAVAVRYIGNKGVGLLRAVDYNQVDITSNGFLEDFLRARSNGFLAEAETGVFDPRFNPAIAGSQELTVFPNIAGGGILTNNGVIRPLIRTGQPGQLAGIYYLNGLEGSVDFVANNNVGVADVLENASSSTYNSLQIEMRRRFTDGLMFQANYTWGKALTDSGVVNADSQSRFTPFLDINNRDLEDSFADFDLPHVFKANVIWELPFGNGKWLDPENGILEAVASGWQTSSIVTLQSGARFGIFSNLGTTNRGGSRSVGKNTAFTNLSIDEIQDNIGIYEQDGVLYFINPAFIDPTTGLGVNDPGDAPFAGQVFFNPEPGTVGNLERLPFTGPTHFQWDLSFIKRTNITENANLELRFEFFNVLNHPTFFVGDVNYGGSLDINNPNFGKISQQQNLPRIVQLAAKINF